MSLNDRIMKLVDSLSSALPQPYPNANAFKNARIIAHRGVHEAPGIKENSRAAFQLALNEGLWGIEFDVRWTRDEVPLILHDPDPFRVYPELQKKLKLPLCELTFNEVRNSTEEIVGLEEVIRDFGGKLHLMIEIKEALNTPQKKQVFKKLLQHLKPAEDFHILSLDPTLYESLEFLPSHCFLPVAEWNIFEFSKMSLERGWAGISGHYLLLHNKMRRRHQKHGQSCGTGFIDSRNLFYRELNRDINWIFTDKALTIKSLLDKALNS